jgi:drug/metabolite transporter (DMT)-like permease
LYKYDITHYNSVAAEQTIIYLASLAFFWLMAIIKDKENPFSFLKKRIFCFQSLINVIPGFLNSYAYVFAPASIILSAYRSSSVFWSVVSGRFYFHEKHFLIKIICLILLAGGIILLAV